jgi:hypothetical protein
MFVEFIESKFPETTFLETKITEDDKKKWKVFEILIKKEQWFK